MEQTEPHHHHGGIYNYFQGATIHNIVINGNMTKNGSDQYQTYEKKEKTPEAKQIAKALQQCKEYIWGNAAYSIAFCTCRDAFSLDNNASFFERIMAREGIVIPEGTINSAMSRNPWMKYHINNWEEQGVMERVLKLRDVFIRKMEMQGFNPKNVVM